MSARTESQRALAEDFADRIDGIGFISVHRYFAGVGLRAARLPWRIRGNNGRRSLRSAERNFRRPGTSLGLGHRRASGARREGDSYERHPDFLFLLYNEPSLAS